MVKVVRKALLIDPQARTIGAVETNGSLEHWHQLIKTEYIERLKVATGEILMYAEEPQPNVQAFSLGSWTIRGRALIVGVTPGGDSRDSKIDVDELRALVKFTKESMVNARDLLKKLPPHGGEVVLTFCNKKSPMKGGPLDHACADTFEVRGKIANKPRWDNDPEHFAVVVPNSPVPLRVIDIATVLSINGEVTNIDPTKNVKQTFVIEGSKKGVTYTVTFDGRHWQCNCPGFNFRRDCRHIDEARKKVE